MSRRFKIRIVSSSIDDSLLLPLWERLHRDHDIEILCTQADENSGFLTHLPVVLFPKIPEMPGFMRDIDHYLAGSDLVVALESSKLSSFQALRWARKSGVPCAIVCHEFTPLIYEKFPNIRAIQHDIYQNADLFLATSHRAMRLLQTEGIAIERMERIPHFVDCSKFGFRKERGQKFRSYVGFRPEDILIVVRGSLQSPDEVSNVFRGFTLALSRIPQAISVRMKLMVIGQGSGVDPLKYEACDLGIGSKVIFLAQDPAKFWPDVTCAAQTIIWTKWTDRSSPEPYPFQMVQALAAGTQSIIPSSSIYDETSAGAPALRLDDATAFGIADAIQRIFSNYEDLEAKRTKLSEFMLEHSDLSLVTEGVLAKLTALVHSTNEPGPRSRALKFIEQHQIPLTYSQSAQAMVCVEEHLLSVGLDDGALSELWRIKGDALAANGQRMDESIRAYEEALKLSSGQSALALRGLGFVSWMSHGHEDALTFFKRSLGIDPNGYHSLLGVGLVYRRLRMLEESVYWLGKAIDIGGVECGALSMCVQACLESPEAELSLTSLKSLRDTWGDKPVILRALSQVYLAQGHGDAAKEILGLVPEAS